MNEDSVHAYKLYDFIKVISDPNVAETVAKDLIHKKFKSPDKIRIDAKDNPLRVKEILMGCDKYLFQQFKEGEISFT